MDRYSLSNSYGQYKIKLWCIINLIGVNNLLLLVMFGHLPLMMDAVSSTICNDMQSIHRKYKYLHNKINYTVILTIYIKPSVTSLRQHLWMAAHASNWGNSLNQCCRGGKWNTMVMMVVGGCCVDGRKNSCTIPTVENLRDGSFSFLSEPL